MFLQDQGQERGEAGKPAGLDAGPTPLEREEEGRALDSGAVPKRLRSSWWEVGEPKPAVGGAPPAGTGLCQDPACSLVGWEQPERGDILESEESRRKEPSSQLLAHPFEYL